MASAEDVGVLRAQLTLSTTQFILALDQTSRKLRRFGNQGARSTKKVSKGFGKVKVGIVAATVALIAFVAVKGIGAFVSLATAAIKTESAFDSYRVRLKSLLGDQKEVNLALAGFVQQAKETPFAVQEVIGAATTLGSVALGNRAKLESLTVQAENVAALTGIPLQAAAVNLQRTLATGIGAADLFRERGVKSLIESINGIPDLTRLPLKEQARLFELTFGEGGKLGDVAKDLSFTLGGSLRNVGDAIDVFKQKLGDAFAPAVIGFAREVLIPFFNKLADLVFENRDLILDLTRRGFGGLLTGFSSVLITGADILSFFLEFAKSIITIFPFLKQLGGFAKVTVGLIKLYFFGLIATLQLALQGLLLIASQTLKALPERFQPTKTIKALDGAIKDLGVSMVNMGAKSYAGLEQINEGLVEITNPEDGMPKIVGQAESLVGFLRKAGRFAARLRGKFDLGVDAAVERRRVSESGEGDTNKFEPPREVSEAFGKFEEGLASGVTKSLNGAIIGALQGDGLDAAKLFGDLSGSFLEFGLAKATKAFEEGFQEVIKGVTNELGENMSAAIGAALGIGLALLSGALEKTKTTGSFADVRDRTESTQAIRGIVVGPTNIAIAEVSTSISDSFVPVIELLGEGNEISRIHTSLLRAIAGGGGLSGASADAIENLSSPALG